MSGDGLARESTPRSRYAGREAPRSRYASREVTLIDLLDRLLGGGVVVQGDVSLAVADIDLVDLSLQLVVGTDVRRRAPTGSGQRRLPEDRPAPAGHRPMPPGQRPAPPRDRPLAPARRATAPWRRPIPPEHRPVRRLQPHRHRRNEPQGEARVGDRHHDKPLSNHRRSSERPSLDIPSLDIFSDELNHMRGGLEARVDADEEKLERGLAQLVMTVIELLRQLMERQAVHRMEAESLTPEEVERLGKTFMALAERMDELKEAFGLSDEDLNLDLGPLGNLM